MRTQYLKSWQTLGLFICLVGTLIVRSSRAACACDPEDTVQFKLQGTAYMAGSATVQITYGTTVQTTTITAPNTVTWTGSQWQISGEACATWDAQITVTPKLDQPVLIQYLFNSDQNNPATPFAYFPPINGGTVANPITFFSRPSDPCLHVWVDLNDDNWFVDPLEVFASSSVFPQFRIKGVIAGDDSSAGYSTGPKAGGGQPQAPRPELNDAQDFTPGDLVCPNSSSMQIANRASSAMQTNSATGFGIGPKSSLSPGSSNHVSSDSFNLQKRSNAIHSDLTGNGYSVFDPIGRLRWEMNLGSQSRTFTLGRLVYQADNIMDSSAYSPAVLSLADGSDPAQVVTDPQTGFLQQILLQNNQGLVNIVTLSDGFEIDVYPGSQVTGSPSLTWKVENPDPTPSGRVQFTEIQGATTEVHMAQWQGTAGSDGTMTITRFNGKWEDVTQYASSTNPNQRIETVSKYKNGVLQHKSKTTYQEFDGWGNAGDVFEAVVQRVEDPDGQALTSSYGYYSDQPELGEEIDPDGYQQVFPNRVLGNGYSPALPSGSPLEVQQPFGDQLNQLEEDVSYQGTPTTLNVTTEKFAAGQVVGYEEKFNTFANGFWDVVTERLADESETYSRQEQAEYIGTRRIAFTEDTQGKTKNFGYAVGFWDGTTFNESSGTFAVQTIVVNGVADAQNGIANETTIDVTVEDQNGHLFAEESYINIDGTGTIYPTNLISETIHDYNSDGREIQRIRDGRSVYSATYNPDGTLASETTDESGQQITYTYDELLRVYQRTIHGRGGDADQVITYEYDVLGNVMSETRTAGGLTAATQWNYDLAGDLQSTTGPDGLMTQFANDYSTGTRVVTESLPTQSTKITSYFADRSVYSTTGSAVEPEYQFPVIFSWGNGFYRPGRQAFRDSAQTELKYSLVQNWFGDEIIFETLQFQSAGYRDRVTSYDGEPDGAGGTQTQRLPMEVSETGRAAQLFTYDSLGRPATQGYDLNNNGVLDPSSTEPITTFSQQFVLNGTTWSVVSTAQQYKQDNSTTETLVQQISAVVPAALPALGQNLMSQTTSTLAGGGTTLTTVTLDSSGNYTTTSNDQEHNQVSTTVQRDGLVRSETMPGVTNPRTYTYTALGEVQTVSDPLTGSLTYAYNPTTRQLTSQTDSLNHQTAYIYYPAGGLNAGQVAGKQDPNGNWTYFDYAPEGQIYRQWGVNTYPVQYQYDAAGHMTQMTTYRTTPGTVNWASSTWPNPPGGDTTQWAYDTASQLLQSKTYPNAGSGATTASYSYNSGNFVQTRVNGRGQTTTYGFDTLGRLDALTYSDGTPSATLNYDRASRLVSCTDASGTHSVTWTDRDQMENETYTAGLLNNVTVDRSYDPQFRLQQLAVQQPAAPKTFEQFTYDSISRLSYVSEMDSTDTTELRRYTYNYASGLPFIQSVAVSQSSTPVMTQNYTRDALGRLAGANVTLAGGSTPYGVNYQFDSLDRRLESDLADGTKWQYGYNNRSEVTSGTRLLGSGAFAGGKQFDYSFDDIGNRLTASFGGDATGANLSQSVYSPPNPLNQLTSRTIPADVWITGDAPGADSLVADANGQVFPIQKQENNQFFGEAPANNFNTPEWLRITVAAESGGSLVDFQTGYQFVRQNPENFTYDADGNLASDGQWNYTWDAENRLIKLVSDTPVGPQQTIAYTYDWLGRRVKKTIWNNTAGTGPANLAQTFVYDGWNLIKSTKVISTFPPKIENPPPAFQSYIWGLDLSASPQGVGGVGGLLAMDITLGLGASATTQTCFYGYDGNGNVMQLIGPDQSIQAQYEYGPFGEVIGATGPLAQANPFCFSTKFQDAETALLYYGHRYFNPGTGRWLSRDPASESGGNNLFAFVSNDPIDQLDVLGLSSCICGPDVTTWFYGEVQAQVAKAQSHQGDFTRTLEFADQAAYDMAYKWMDFSVKGCATGPCKDTVTLAGTCLRKNQLGNMMFMIVGTVAKVGKLGFFSTPDSIARKGHNIGSVYPVDHPHAENYGVYAGQARTDNIAAFGVGNALGNSYTQAMQSPQSFNQFLNSAMNNSATLNRFGNLAGQTLTPNNLTFVPEYGGFNTANCKTTCPQVWNGQSSFAARQALLRSYVGSPDSIANGLGGHVITDPSATFDNWLKKNYEDYYNPNWQSE